MFRRTIIADVVQGIIVGAVLAFITANLFINAEVNAMQTAINGWSITCNAACPATTFFYGSHAPRTSPPPTCRKRRCNDAFWSLTMTDANRLLVTNSIDRYSVGDRSGLVSNADGSSDIYIQNTAPTGHESNWLPAPSGDFMLWLRAYQPGAAILSGEYHVPPVVEVK